MDACFNGDIASLDPELLQIPELSPTAVKANPRVAEELFDLWLSHPETNSLDERCFTLHELKGNKLSANVFNILFNLNKFMTFETRDPFLIRQERENPNLTEWDRFAHREYINGFRWRKMRKMLLMEVQMFGMNHLRLLFEL